MQAVTVPNIEPNHTSIKKCCPKYTREYAVNAAKTKVRIPKDLFFETIAIVADIAKAEVVWPEGNELK